MLENSVLLAIVTSSSQIYPTKGGQNCRVTRTLEAPASVALGLVDVFRTGSRIGVFALNEVVGQSRSPAKIAHARITGSGPIDVSIEGGRAGIEPAKPCTPLRQLSVFCFPTKLCSETYGGFAICLRFRWNRWDSNPQTPAYKACTPKRQSGYVSKMTDEIFEPETYGALSIKLRRSRF